MGLAVATSPARVSNSAAVTSGTAQNANATVATASFTPPAGALLVAVVMADTGDDTPNSSANAANITITVTGGSLTWTNRVERDKGDGSGANFGHVSIHTAVVGSSSSMTVTATRTQATTYSGSLTIKVYVVTGQAASPIGVNGEGSSTTNNLTASAFTSTAANSFLFTGATDWSENGVFTSSDLTIDTNTVSGALSAMSGYKSLGATGAQTANLNAGGSGATTLNWVALEILPLVFAGTLSKSIAGVTAAVSGTFKPKFTGSVSKSIAGVTVAAAGATTPPTFTGLAAKTIGPATFSGSATFTSPGGTYSGSLAHTLGGATISGNASFANISGFTSRSTTTASGTGSASISINPTPGNSVLIFAVAQAADYLGGSTPSIEIGSDNGLVFTSLETAAGGHSVLAVYLAEAAGADTVHISTDQEDAEVTIVVREYADFGLATEIDSSATFGGGGDNPNLSTFTSTLTASSDGEMFVAAIVIPAENVTTLGAGADWSNFTNVKLNTPRIGIEEITVPTVGASYNADFTSSGLSSPGWYGLWLKLSSQAPRTGAATVSTGAISFSGSAGFQLVYRGSVSRTLGPVAFSGAGAVTPPILTASMNRTAGAVTISSTGTTLTPVYSGSISRTLGRVTITASGSVTVPVYHGSMSHTIGAVGLSGSGHAGVPIFIASASKTTAGVSFVGSGSTTLPVYAGNCAVVTAGADISGTGTTTAPRYTALSSISSGHVTFAASAAFVAGSFNVAWSIVPQRLIEMKRNTANQIVSLHLTNRGNGSDVVTGTTTVYVTIDGGTQTAGAGTIEHEGNGEWSYRPTKAETNGDYLSFTFTNASAVTQTVSVSTTAGPVSPADDINYINCFLTVRDESGVPWPSGVLNHQIVGVDPGFGGAWDDDEQQSTANNQGVITISFPRGVYVRYWQPGGRYRTAHLTDALADPYALPSITG